jgi:hypothetical protein
MSNLDSLTQQELFKATDTAARVSPGNREVMTAGKAIRRMCVDCIGKASAVEDCQGDQLYGGPCLVVPLPPG